MIIFGTRTKYVDGTFPITTASCDYCHTPQALNAYRQIKYFHVFWIPVFPYSSGFITVCDHCKKVQSEREMAPEIRNELYTNTKKRTPIRYFSGAILIALIIGSAVVAGISSSIKTKKYLQDPLVGDVYEMKRNENGRSIYTLYRVADVTPDSVVFDVNDYEAEGRKGLRKLWAQRADSYSEKASMARSEVIKLKEDNQLSSIKRNGD